jgi:probable phosphoglycerate mutase
MTHFVVIRHGETEWNVANRVQGHGDSRLTAAGRAQARSLALRLAGEHFDLLVSSDLGRALETAQPLAEASAHAIQRDARLRERNFGAGEGLSYEEIGKRYPGAFPRVAAVAPEQAGARFSESSEADIDPDYAIPGGESRRQFHDRVAEAFEALAAGHPEARIVVVTHGGVLGALYRHVHGIPVASPHRIPIANASYNAVSCHGPGAWTVHAWADIAHLPAGPAFDDT